MDRSIARVAVYFTALTAPTQQVFALLILNSTACYACCRVPHSLRLKRVCSAMDKSVVVEGAALPAVVKGVEDHGFTLSLGIKVRGGIVHASVRHAGRMC
jgi:hypothetical protein